VSAEFGVWSADFKKWGVRNSKWDEAERPRSPIHRLSLQPPIHPVTYTTYRSQSPTQPIHLYDELNRRFGGAETTDPIPDPKRARGVQSITSPTLRMTIRRQQVRQRPYPRKTNRSSLSRIRSIRDIGAYPQSFPARFPNDSQPLPNRYPTDTQPIPNRYPTDTQPIPNRYPTDTQPIPFRYLFDTLPLVCWIRTIYGPWG
jgi:hypothetical protein